MSTNPNQGQRSDQTNPYGGYSGYNSSNSTNGPYGGYSNTGAQQNDPNYTYGQAGQQQQQQQSYSQPGQQSSAYVPPDSVSRGRSQDSMSPQARRNALISYLGLCFTGIFMFFWQRKNSYVRFHAAQSLVLFVPLFILYIIIGILLKIPILGFLVSLIVGFVSPVFYLIVGVIWILLMVQAYRGVTVRLPYVADYADALIRRFDRRNA